MDVDIVDYHIGYMLYRNAPTTCDLNMYTTPIDGLEASHLQGSPKLDAHVTGEYNPHWTRLAHGIS